MMRRKTKATDPRSLALDANAERGQSLRTEARLRDLARRYWYATGLDAVSSYGKGSGLFVRGFGWVPEAEAERHIASLADFAAFCDRAAAKGGAA